MSEAYEQALAVVMELPETERRALADAVYDSLMTPEEDEALFAELERRRAEHESGRDPGIPADELFQRLRGKQA
jgi:putative addiction module component (TIGR02574 family)